jgi:hypothetical protein
MESSGCSRRPLTCDARQHRVIPTLLLVPPDARDELLAKALPIGGAAPAHPGDHVGDEDQRDMSLVSDPGLCEVTWDDAL